MDLTTAVNFAVVIALLVMTAALFLVAWALLPLLSQAQSTLVSVSKLSDTMEREVGPTMAELRSVMDGVNQIKSITAQRVHDVGSKAEELTGSVTTLVGSAKKESSVASAGLLAGLKAYLFHHQPDSEHEHKLEAESKAKPIQMNRERKNVELKH